MLRDTRVSTDDYSTETIEVLGPSDARRCEHCAEPPEFEVRHTIESGMVEESGDPMHWHLCGTCLARLQREAKDDHDVTIVQRAKRASQKVGPDGCDRRARGTTVGRLIRWEC